MKFFGFKRKAPDPRTTSRNATVFVSVVLLCVLISSLNIMSTFPWNGNPIAWLKAKDYFDQGKKLHANYRLADAEKKLQAAVKEYDADWQMQQALGQTLMARGKDTEAELAFRRALKLHKSADLYLDLTEALLRQEKFAQAEESAKQAAELEPNEGTPMSMLAYALQSQGKVEEAADVFKTSNALNKESGRYWYFAGNYQCAIGQISKAEIDFRQAADLARTNAEYWETIGAFLFAKQDLDPAEIFLKRAARLNSLEPGYWDRLARLYLAKQDLEQAENAYSKALDLQPQNIRFVQVLAASKYLQEKYKKAEPLFKQVLQKEPQNAFVWKCYLDCIQKQNKTELLQKETEQCLQTVNSQFASDWGNLASICNTNKDYGSADRALDTATGLAKDPDSKNEIDALRQRLLAERVSQTEKSGR